MQCCWQCCWSSHIVKPQRQSMWRFLLKDEGCGARFISIGNIGVTVSCLTGFRIDLNHPAQHHSNNSVFNLATLTFLQLDRYSPPGAASGSSLPVLPQRREMFFRHRPAVQQVKQSTYNDNQIICQNIMSDRYIYIYLYVTINSKI